MNKKIILGAVLVLIIAFFAFNYLIPAKNFNETVKMSNDVWTENGLEMNGFDYDGEQALNLSQTSLTKIKDELKELKKANFSEKETSLLFIEINESLANLIIDSKKALETSQKIDASEKEACEETNLREEYILNETKRINSIKELKENFEEFQITFSTEANELRFNDLSFEFEEERLNSFKAVHEEIQKFC